MKRGFVALCLFALLAAVCSLHAAAPVVWKLKYTEEFKGTKINSKIWSRIDAWSDRIDWIKNMSLREDLVEVKNGILYLKGVRNEDKASDPRSVLTGGIMTKGKFAVQYGKIEVKARFHGQKGAWPAIWMMPEAQPKGWPHDGEIDIVERLNNDPFVYQTVHSGWTQGHPNDPPRGGRGPIKQDDWNVYGLEWTDERIVWKVNGKETHHYDRIGDDPERYPWTAPFYLMLDMQLGGQWVGGVDESTLPVEMEVDWVKFYSGSRGGKSFTRFVTNKKR